MKPLLLTLAALLITVTVSAQAPVPIYVTSVGAVNGRTDPNKDNQDTVADLQKQLAKRRGRFTLVETPEQAVLVLRVLNREIDRHVSTGKWGKVLSGKNTEHGVVLRVAVEYQGAVSEVSTSVAGSEGFGVWGRAADKLADQIEKWANDNQVAAR